MADPIELDGRTLEGGGQLLRIALCLSALTGTPIKIHSIRGNRSRGGGLKPQHLACVNWLAHASNAHVEGASKGSKTLLFQPKRNPHSTALSPAFQKVTRPNGEEVYESRLEIGTAGSTGLALQAILPFILFTRFPRPLPVHVTLSGGTNVSGSPSFEYIQHVLLPTLSRIGFPEMKITLGKRGWSQGGSTIGNFTLEIPPRRGQEICLPGFSYGPSSSDARPSLSTSCSLQAIYIAPTSTHTHFHSFLLSSLQTHFPSLPSAAISISCLPSLHEKRFYALLALTCPSSNPSPTSKSSNLPRNSTTEKEEDSSYTLAATSLPETRISSSNLLQPATELASSLPVQLAQDFASGSWVDEHLRDQLVIFAALARGRSTVYPGREASGASSGDREQTEKAAHDEERKATHDEEKNAALRPPSLHTRTAEWVCEQLLGRRGCRFDGEGGCEGIGFGSLAEGEGENGEEREEGLEGKMERLEI